MPVYQCYSPKGTDVLEAGPELGHEHEWFEENRAKLAELGIMAP